MDVECTEAWRISSDLGPETEWSSPLNPWLRPDGLSSAPIARLERGVWAIPVELRRKGVGVVGTDDMPLSPACGSGAAAADPEASVFG